MLGQAMTLPIAGPVCRHEQEGLAGAWQETGWFKAMYAENQRLQARNRTLETVAYTVSHDLRSPLRAIDGFSKSLLEDLGDAVPGTVRRHLHEIQAGVERMQIMIGQWLSFIRTGCTVQRERVNLSVLAYSVITELYAAEPKRSVVVYIEPELHADGDAMLLRQLLQNLLENAWKFTRPDDEHAVIAFGAVVDDQGTTYFVRDNGIGFAAADARKMFAPFTRLAQSRDVDGHGIGLAIARSIVDTHGGQIWAEGEPGAGAHFYFTLPAATRDEQAA